VRDSADGAALAGGAVALLVALGVAAAALAIATVAYRRLFVRLLRERHAPLWEELGRPEPLIVPWAHAARRLRAFLRAGRHYTLNDADVAAAGRLHVVTARALAALISAAAAVWFLGRG
jgi:hypothetical protein